jgi:hypothetical protein
LDSILTEDPLNTFDYAFPIEMYMENRFKRDMNKIKIKEFFYFVLQNMGRNKQ